MILQFKNYRQLFTEWLKKNKRMIDALQVANEQIASLQQEMAEVKCRCNQLEIQHTVTALQINFLTNSMATSEMFRQWEMKILEERTQKTLNLVYRRLSAIETDIEHLQTSSSGVYEKAFAVHPMPSHGKLEKVKLKHQHSI